MVIQDIDGGLAMAKNLTVILENKPGTLAEMAESLGRAGVNIAGGAGFPCEGRGVMQVLVEDAAAARSALEGTGSRVDAERDVIVMDIGDRPGALGEVCRRAADAGVNVDLVYLAANTRLVIGGEDIEALRAAVS
jgi:hypothetical protein